MRRLLLIAGFTGLALSGSGMAARAQSTPPQPNWVSTWQTPPSSNVQNADFANFTIRQTAFTSLGGNAVRVRISNVDGTAPLYIGAVHIAAAQSASTGTIIPSTDLAFTFGGVNYVTIPPGGVALSDAMTYSVAPNSDYLISTYTPQSTGLPTFHPQGSYPLYAATGNQVSNAVLSGAGKSTGTVFVSGLDVQAASPTDGIVAFGDSITDGFGASTGTNTSWPNLLSIGLAKAGKPMAVSDAGINGDQLLIDGPANFPTIAGQPGIQSGLARFERDVTSMPGVTKVILALGINDLGGGGYNTNLPSAYDLIQGYNQMILKAHERNIKVYAATITPCGAFSTYYNAAFEAKRQVMNNFIKLGFFDGVIDFDAVVRDPANPANLLPAYSSGDGIHPNSAGYAVMAAAAQAVVLK